MHATSLPLGMICAPGQRYHPAIVAQAAATLSEMFPGRFWMAIGSGQALNESITGERWPSKEERERAMEGAYEQWKTNVLDNSVLTELRHPEHLEAAARFVRKEDLHGSVRISGDVEQHIDWPPSWAFG